MKTRLFVYGTLKRGGSNHGYLERQEFIGQAMTEPLYRLYDLGGYPGMVSDAANGRSVSGEVWDVDEACLAVLDVLEGIEEGEYVRERIPLLPPHNQEIVVAYRYLRPVAGCRDLGSVW